MVLPGGNTERYLIGKDSPLRFEMRMTSHFESERTNEVLDRRKLGARGVLPNRPRTRYYTHLGFRHRFGFPKSKIGPLRLRGHRSFFTPNFLSDQWGNGTQRPLALVSQQRAFAVTAAVRNCCRTGSNLIVPELIIEWTLCNELNSYIDCERDRGWV